MPGGGANTLCGAWCVTIRKMGGPLPAVIAEMRGLIPSVTGMEEG
jgi:hypothetical protein